MNYKNPVNKQIIEGTVICSFVVTTNGYILNPTIVKKLSDAADAKVIDLVSNMPIWVGGKKDGQPVNVQLTVPVTFRRIE